MKNKIHPTAIIDDGAEIGDGTNIWHWALVCWTIIGKGVSLGQNVFVGNNVKIETGVRSRITYPYTTTFI